MASSVIKKRTKKIFTVTHGNINPGASSTVQVSKPSPNMYVIGISISGAYNSDCVPWSYYYGDNEFISRIKNTGSNMATDITVRYDYLDE